MNLERFIEELQDCNKVLYELDDAMEVADLSEEDYYNYVFERIKTANTNATKASYYFSLVPNKVKADFTRPLITTVTRLRKTSRALFLWILLSKDALITFIFDGDEGDVEVDLITIDDIIDHFMLLCDSVDILSRLVVCDDMLLIHNCKERIIGALDLIEEMFDLINMIGFEGNQLGYLNGCLTDMLTTVEKIHNKANRRLGIDE